jgi:hypothetical protein
VVCSIRSTNLLQMILKHTGAAHHDIFYRFYFLY